MPAASSATFWLLMERWHVPDGQALELIGFEGKPRRRFKFTPEQARTLSALQAIDSALEFAGLVRYGCIADAADCAAEHRWSGSRPAQLTRFSGCWPRRRWRRR
jgi:hypothetical protein